jgi:hypothetical protein
LKFPTRDEGTPVRVSPVKRLFESHAMFNTR